MSEMYIIVKKDNPDTPYGTGSRWSSQTPKIYRSERKAMSSLKSHLAGWTYSTGGDAEDDFEVKELIFK
jgi:hypothetical protein